MAAPALPVSLTRTEAYRAATGLTTAGFVGGMIASGLCSGNSVPKFAIGSAALFGAAVMFAPEIVRGTVHYGGKCIQFTADTVGEFVKKFPVTSAVIGLASSAAIFAAGVKYGPGLHEQAAKKFQDALPEIQKQVPKLVSGSVEYIGKLCGLAAKEVAKLPEAAPSAAGAVGGILEALQESVTK